MKNFWEKESRVLLVGLLGLCLGFILGEKLEQRKVLMCTYEYVNYYYDMMPRIMEGGSSMMANGEQSTGEETKADEWSVDPAYPDDAKIPGGDAMLSYYPYYPYYPSQQALVCRYINHKPTPKYEIVY